MPPWPSSRCALGRSPSWEEWRCPAGAIRATAIATRVRRLSGTPPPGPTCNAFTTLTSMMPGTLPAGIDDDHGALLYHCLDVEQSVAAQLAIDEGLLIRALGETHDDT